MIKLTAKIPIIDIINDFKDVTRHGEVHVESVNFVVADGDRKLRRKSSKKLIDNSEIVSSIFVSEHLVILGGADGQLFELFVVNTLKTLRLDGSCVVSSCAFLI